jgi:hypothetical protein
VPPPTVIRALMTVSSPTLRIATLHISSMPRSWSQQDMASEACTCGGRPGKDNALPKRIFNAAIPRIGDDTVMKARIMGERGHGDELFFGPFSWCVILAWPTCRSCCLTWGSWH